MSMAVELDMVARRHDLGRQRGTARDLLSHQEEGRGRPGIPEYLQDKGRALRMRAVIEGQRHTAEGRLSMHYSQRWADPGCDGGERRTGVNGNGG
jgi:hypothetical protein